MIKNIIIALLLCAPINSAIADNVVLNLADESITKLSQKKWIHGAEDCNTNHDPLIEVYQFDQTSYILRQNKCTTFEAPFIYVLFGKESVLVLDTGAIEDTEKSPIYQTILKLLREQPEASHNNNIIVLHTHGHGDHYKGDIQFVGKPNANVIGTNMNAITEYFGFDQWPEGIANIELGNRKILVIPTPGHQEEAISLYDPQTKWLLTGDTFYPGYIYIKDWSVYRQSIDRLTQFISTHEVNAILGTHIEMKESGRDYYAFGSTYQPDEASLILTTENLTDLNNALLKQTKEKEIVFDDYIIKPMNFIQKSISNMSRRLMQ